LFVNGTRKAGRTSNILLVLETTSLRPGVFPFRTSFLWYLHTTLRSPMAATILPPRRIVKDETGRDMV
jgi:hypothetical protein